VEHNIDHNDNKTSFTLCYPSYPTIITHAIDKTTSVEDDHVTVVTLNISPLTHEHPQPDLALANVQIKCIIDSNYAFADTGATSIFIMDTEDIANKEVTTDPIR
jgi:hypothetical protein